MRTIIVGVDLSPHADIAVGHAIDLARAEGGALVIAHADVPAEIADRAPASAVALTSELVANRAADARRELAAIRARWTGRGIEIDERVIDGYPDEALPALATELGADAIVVASHGRTGFKRLLLGSVAERVVRFAPCAVMVARGEAPIGGYHHLVVGTDFAETAARALARAVEIAAPRAKVDVVHCWQESPMIGLPDAPGAIPAYGAVRGGLIEQLRRDGEALVEEAGAGRDLELRFHLLERPAAHGIDDFAREVRADLIVVGSHGRRGMRRFLVGSIAEVAVRHAPCAALVVR